MGFDTSETFTDRAKTMMAMSHHEAVRLSHPYIGTEHILLGLLADSEKRGDSGGSKILRNFADDFQAIKEEIEKLLPIGPEPITQVKLPATQPANRVILYAIEESKRLRHHNVGTDHLLLGLLREKTGMGAVILTNRGLQIDVVRKMVADQPLHV